MDFYDADKRLILRTLERLSADETIDSYITCSCCGKKQVSDAAALNRIVAVSKSADDFLSRTSRQHRH